MAGFYKQDNDDAFALRRVSFDTAAALYDKARPTYPEQLFDDLVDIAHLSKKSSALEIGSGTGKASIDLAKRIGQLVCIEPGRNLAEIAKRNLKAFPSVGIINSTFEAWTPSGRFPIVFAAASWHWLDKSVRYAKAASIIEEGGCLAIVTNEHAFPDGFDPGFAEIQECYAAVGITVDWEHRSRSKPQDFPSERDEIIATGLFSNVEIRHYLWTSDYSSQEYIDLLETYSDHRVADPQIKERLYPAIRSKIEARPGGTIRKHYLTTLNVAVLGGRAGFAT